MHRLRDLTRPQAAVAAVFVVLLSAHVAVSVARAGDAGWLPTGDDALIGLRALDVGTGETPTIGQPSSSHLYDGEIGTAHPGPIEFFWLAVPVRVAGPAAGMLVGAAAFNLVSVLVASWVVLRRAGPGVAAWAAVLLGALLWSEGTAILSDPISSSASAIPLLALATLAWAVADGDLRLLPLGAVFGAWVTQQHLSIVVPGAALVAWAVVVTGVRYLRRTDRTERWWPWVLGAAAISLVLWAPVVIQQVTGDPGNLSEVARYAREGEGPSVGAVAGARQVARALGVASPLLRDDLTGDQLFGGPLRVGETVAAALVAVALVAAGVAAWRRRRSLSTLVATLVVLAVAGGWNGSAIPNSVEAYRTNFYRWTYVVAWLAWIALGWAAALATLWVLDRRDLEPADWVTGRAAPAAACVALLVPTVLTATTRGANDDRRDQDGFGALAELGDTALAATDPGDEVTLVLEGRSAVLSSGAALALTLVADDREVAVPMQEERFWGTHRVHERGDDPGDVILLLTTGRGDVAAGPGEKLARVDLNEELRDELEPLAEVAREGPLEVSDRAGDLLDERFDPAQHEAIASLMASIGDQPERVLTEVGLLDLVASGYFASPRFDPEQVERLARLLPGAFVNEDDVFELRELTAEELEATLARWEGS